MYKTKIAICLLGDKKRANEQIKESIGIEKIYDIEWFLRSDMYNGLYHTYSQAVNEAAMLTNSEYMIFINPKSNVTCDLINEIIIKLKEGYGLAAVSSFGFWGCCKELFREIGLLDERFLGGEHEDTDFIFRLKISNIAIYVNNYDNVYNYHNSEVTFLRGLSDSILDRKWIELSGVRRCKAIDMLEEKKLPHILNNRRNDQIKKNWKHWKDSFVNGTGYLSRAYIATNSIEFIKDDLKLDFIETKIDINLSKTDDILNIHVNKTEVVLYFLIVEKDNYNKVINKKQIKISSEVEQQSFIKLDKNLEQSLKIMCEGRVIYINDKIKEFKEFNLKTNLNVSKPSIQYKLKSNTTFVLTSCGRNDLLEKTLDSFFKYNTYPIERYIIIEDSADIVVFNECERLNKEKYDGKLEFLFNYEKLGQSKSIDKAYSMVETEYIFHCEEDWEFYKGGFIEESIKVLKTQPKVIQAWIRPKSDNILNKIQPNIYNLPLDVSIRIVEPASFIVRGANDDGSDMIIKNYMGFSWNPGVKRIKDWKELSNGYSGFEREHLVDQYYRDNGFMVVSLSKDDTDGYVKHIGWNRRAADPVYKNKE